MRTVLLLVTVVAFLSCGGGGTGGTGGGSAGTGGGSAGTGGGTASCGTGGGTATGDADAGLCDSTMKCPAGSSYVDATACSASRVVNFGADGGFSADPQCLKIKAGQQVTFHTGQLHPIGQNCGPVNGLLQADMTSTKTLTFNVPGDYGYYCTIHDFLGFITVVP
jgi:plastocyanin